MVITNSNVSLASQREYSRQASAKSTTSGTQLGTNAQFVIYSDFSTSINEEESYINASGDSYEPSAYDYPTLIIPSSTYSPDGLFTDYSATSGETRMEAIQKSAMNPVKGLKGGDLFGEVSNKVYRSLLEFIQNMQLRGLFNNSLLDNFQQSSNNSELYLTNSSSTSTWNVTQTDTYSMSESECTSFQGTGYAVTADGRKITFDIGVTMSREYMEESEIEYVSQYQKIFTDPLVINLDSSPTEISGQSFMFDIDNDGEEEEIASMTSSSGFLAIDRNEDGIINDGSELFGTSTGNGFGELAEYDDDGNGWIDENDAVYSKLRVWVKDEDGNDKLMNLKEADVGAIYLGSSKTQFSLTNDSNEAQGMVRSTGVYLHESGTVGTVQQVDF